MTVNATTNTYKFLNKHSILIRKPNSKLFRIYDSRNISEFPTV